jgi:hypothetical protein
MGIDGQGSHFGRSLLSRVRRFFSFVTSFSVTASLLNRNSTIVYRARRQIDCINVFAETIPSNAPRLLAAQLSIPADRPGIQI